MKRPLLLLAVIVGLVAASLVAIALRPAVLGLDLQGGVEVILQGQPTDESEVTPEAIDRSVEIIRSRVDAFGVSEPEIQTQGSDQIVVALPGAENPNKVVTDLIQPAQLVFINYERNLVPFSSSQEGTTDLYRRSSSRGAPSRPVRAASRPSTPSRTRRRFRASGRRPTWRRSARASPTRRSPRGSRC